MATSEVHRYYRPMLRPALVLFFVAWTATSLSAQPIHREIDLAALSTDSGELLRVHGADGNGAFGTPVAGGEDCDGDGNADFMLASMLASPLARDRAGRVDLIFGTGAIEGSVDTAVSQARVLTIAGADTQENCGNEIWMDDVSGDGLADLLIGRQNFSPSAARTGAGALTILIGGAGLRQVANAGAMVDLRGPGGELTVTTIVGTQRLGRFGMWMRSGDVTGDGVADLVVGADQEDHTGSTHSGAVYLIRGGPHLATNQIVALDALDESTLAGQVLRIDPPPLSPHLHFGSTCQIGDLNNNGRGEVMIGTALNRAGGILPAAGQGGATAHGVGGTTHGTALILWDDNFPGGSWPADLHFGVTSLRLSTISGGQANSKFGEELLGDADYDGDGRQDLYIGDLSADLSAQGNQPNSGAAYILYDAAQLQGRGFNIDDVPTDLHSTTIAGEARGDIAGDTAMNGDYDGDGIDDLLIGSPHATVQGRIDAGRVHVLFGQTGGWPSRFDLPIAGSDVGLRATEILGAHGRVERDDGDVVAYSVGSGDADGDGRADVIVNEMEGNGLSPTTIDVGNLIVVDGALVATGVDLVECPATPLSGCSAAASSVLRWRFGGGTSHRSLQWRWRGAGSEIEAALGDPIAGATSYALCVYDASQRQRPALALVNENQSACPGCWQEKERARRFRKRQPQANDVKASNFRIAESGHSDVIEVNARDWRSRSENGPFALPLIVQLIAGEGRPTTRCWQAEYTQARSNAPDRFAARYPR